MISSDQLEKKIANRLKRKRSYRVILRTSEGKPDAMKRILSESFRDLGVTPSGKVLIKPNVVTANKNYIHHSYTNPEMVGEAIKLMHEAGVSKVTVGESGGYGIPSRLFFNEAGYNRLTKLGAKVVDFNIERSRRCKLSRGMHHQSMQVSKSLAEADFLLWMPKLKYHICCTITCALKLNVGILRHKERMLYHDDRLDEKIVDLLEVGYPDLLATDAIEVGHGFESAPKSIHLGAIMVADDPVAMDIVACRILGYDPSECKHLVMAMERGYGPPSMDAVQVEGDVTIDALRAVTKDVVSEYQDIHQVDTPINFYCGKNPERGRLCHGGCIVAVKGCLGTIDKRRPGSVAKAKPGAIVTGVYKGDVDAGEGVALLVGDCTRVEGRITARKIKRVKGCPMGAKELFFVVPGAFGLPSPLMDLVDAVKFIVYSIDKFFRRLFSFLKA